MTPNRFVPSLESFEGRVNLSSYSGSHALYQDIAVPTASADDQHGPRVEDRIFEWEKAQEIRPRWFSIVDRTTTTAPMVKPLFAALDGDRTRPESGVNFVFADGSVRGLSGGVRGGILVGLGDGSVRGLSGGVNRTPIVDGPNVVYVGGSTRSPRGDGTAGVLLIRDSQALGIGGTRAPDADVVVKGSLVKVNAAGPGGDETITIHGSRTE